jgi:predicted MPP superfamily phosphohydrolase
MRQCSPKPLWAQVSWVAAALCVFDEGHFRVAGTELVVTAGVGADFPPLRIYCPPEILVVDITRR